jgi:hypothetical protein
VLSTTFTRRPSPVSSNSPRRRRLGVQPLHPAIISDKPDDGGGFMYRLRYLVYTKQHTTMPDLTFVRISELLRLNPQLVGRYATGDKMPSIESNARLAALLEVDPGWLLYGGRTGRPVFRAKRRRAK